MQSNKDHIHAIIEAIAITPDRKLLHRQKEFNAYAGYGEQQVISNEMLLQNLQSLIYTTYYCRGEEAGANLMDSRPDDIRQDDDDRSKTFREELSQANASMERWDYGWHIETRDSSGSFHAHKGNHTRQLYAGDFIKEFDAHDDRKNERVRIWMHRESDDPTNAFYYAFGNSLTEDDNQVLIRFYFNILPQGAPALVKGITTTFNHYFIPFQFKCLNDPEYYVRHDAAVLYINRRYTTIAFSILSGLYSNLHHYFKPGTPLFTKKITKGFAFAENPINPQESFGTSRARIIASPIVSAFNDGVPQDQWTDKVIKSIEASGYSLENFHLNPGSHFPYHFYDLTCYQYAS